MSIDVIDCSRRRPLAACVAAILMLSAPLAEAATTWTVNTCDEANAGTGTTGSLRYAATNAISGDTIDMTGLACSAITLSTGAILFAQADITVKGPGKGALTINGNNDRVFRHVGSGAFNLNDLTVAGGYVHPSLGADANGGCISSNGKAYLTGVGVHNCRASAVGAAAHGGGVYARDMVFAKYSDISGNVASGSGISSGGGGIFSYRDVVVANSTISGNSALGSSGGIGGGVRVLLGNVTVIASTISGNIANFGGGIAQLFSSAGPQSFALHNSTISGNIGIGLVGGIATGAGTIEVKNSTVAFNTAGSASGASRHYSPGLSIEDTGGYYTDINHYRFIHATLESSVFSNNAYGTPATQADDVGVRRANLNLSLVMFTGQNNLFFATQAQGIPGRGMIGVCPGLGPLRDNGGSTQTHALAWGSPAIDQGNNTVPFAVDQRGSPFARVSGTTADIGAYEVQQGDIVFINGFDGPPVCSG